MSELEEALKALATRGWWTRAPGAGADLVAQLRRAASRRGVRLQISQPGSGELIAMTVDGLPAEEPWRGAAEHALNSGALTQMRLAEAHPGTTVRSPLLAAPHLLELPLQAARRQCREHNIELIIDNANDLAASLLSDWATDGRFEQRWRVDEQRPQPGSHLEEGSVSVKVTRDGDDGGAGVREPRRPTPPPQWLRAESEPDYGSP